MVKLEITRRVSERSGSEGLPRQTNSTGLKLNPTRLLAADNKKVNFGVIEALANRSITSSHDLDRRTVIELCKFAALLEVTEIASHHPLDGKIIVTAFFEPSTRTRLSFETAVLRLDGKIVSVPDGRVTGVAKGEALEDMGEMLNTYGDLVVLRHTETDALARVQKYLQVPLINAGNGSGEHPTQALVDWYTLLKWRPQFVRSECSVDDKVHLGIVGTPGSMRAVKSFLIMALLFPEHIRKITVVSEMVDPLGEGLDEAARASAIPVEHTNDIHDVLGDLDVIYMNSIAFLGDSYRKLDGRYKLDAQSPLKEGAVIMHPFARNSELDMSLDETPHNLYFAQAASAVFIRQALLVGLLDRVSALPASLRLLTH